MAAVERRSLWAIKMLFEASRLTAYARKRAVAESLCAIARLQNAEFLALPISCFFLTHRISLIGKANTGGLSIYQYRRWAGLFSLLQRHMRARECGKRPPMSLPTSLLQHYLPQLFSPAPSHPPALHSSLSLLCPVLLTTFSGMESHRESGTCECDQNLRCMNVIAARADGEIVTWLSRRSSDVVLHKVGAYARWPLSQVC